MSEGEEIKTIVIGGVAGLGVATVQALKSKGVVVVSEEEALTSIEKLEQLHFIAIESYSAPKVICDERPNKKKARHKNSGRWS